jgi:hypothetical protein
MMKKHAIINQNPSYSCFAEGVNPRKEAAEERAGNNKSALDVRHSTGWKLTIKYAFCKLCEKLL